MSVCLHRLYYSRPQEGLLGIGFPSAQGRKVQPEEIILHINTIPERIIDKPQRHLATGKMDLGVKHAVILYQRCHHTKHGIDVLVEFVKANAASQ